MEIDPRYDGGVVAVLRDILRSLLTKRPFMSAASTPYVETETTRSRTVSEFPLGKLLSAILPNILLTFPSARQHICIEYTYVTIPRDHPM